MDIVLGGTSLVILVGIFVQLAKMYGIATRYLPLLSVLLGLAGGLTAFFYGDLPLTASIVGGIMSGATASGLYDVGKRTIAGK